MEERKREERKMGHGIGILEERKMRDGVLINKGL
jgi:hypothetical protein